VKTVTGLLRDLVLERTGICVDENMTDLFVEKLSDLITERGFTSLLDYYYLLKYDAEAAVEWPKVIDTITVRETYFRREFDQIQLLVSSILPRHFKNHAMSPFRIWSAAAASGEEPLTIAMAIDQAGFSGLPIEIVASDVSQAALRIAREGLYRERSFRNMSPEMREIYFTRQGDRWKINPYIQQKVTWASANLTREDEISKLAASNVIFCRNVFIYFHEDTIRKIVKTFAKRILPPGFLFVGAPESLVKLTTDFQLNEMSGAFVYVRSFREEVA
jgi:chemotaxis protein methyltransferase CheR